MTTNLQEAQVFANEMDTKFKFLGVRFGYDALLSLIPVIGPLISFCVSLQLLAVVPNLDITFRQKYMSSIAIVTLLFLDAVMGGIPVLGLVVDVVFKANTWIVRMLKADDQGLTMFSAKK